MRSEPDNDNHPIALPRWWLRFAEADRKSILVAMVGYGSLAAIIVIGRMVLS